jgi:hypothetical protein
MRAPWRCGWGVCQLVNNVRHNRPAYSDLRSGGAHGSCPEELTQSVPRDERYCSSPNLKSMRQTMREL